MLDINKVLVPTGADSVINKPTEVALEIENNGKKLPLVFKQFKRGGYKDQAFVTVDVGADLPGYIEARGVENIIAQLQSREDLNNQAALFKFSQRGKGTNPTTNEEIKYPIAGTIKWPALLNAIAKNECRGETIKELMAQAADLTVEIADLSEALFGEDGSPDLEVVGKVRTLGAKLRGLQAAIEEKRRNKTTGDDDDDDATTPANAPK